MSDKLNILITALLNTDDTSQIESQLNQLAAKLKGKLKLSIGLDDNIDNLTKLLGDIKGVSQSSFGEATKDAKKFSNEIDNVEKKLRALRSERKGIEKHYRGMYNESTQGNMWKQLKEIKPKLPKKGDQLYTELYEATNKNQRSTYFTSSRNDGYSSKMGLDEAAESLGLRGSDELVQKIKDGNKKFDSSMIKDDPKIKSIDDNIRELENYKNKLTSAAMSGEEFSKVVNESNKNINTQAAEVKKLSPELGKLGKVTDTRDAEGNPLSLDEQFINPKKAQTTTNKYKFDENNNPVLDKTIQTTNVDGLDKQKKQFDVFAKDATTRIQALSETKLPTHKVDELVKSFGKLDATSDKLDLDVFKKSLAGAEKYADNLHKVQVEQNKLKADADKLKTLDSGTLSKFNDSIDSSKNLKQIDLLKGELRELQEVNKANLKGEKEKADRILNNYKVGKKIAEQEIKDINAIEKKREESVVNSQKRDRQEAENQQKAIQKNQEKDWDDRNKLANQMADGRARGSFKEPDWDKEQAEAIRKNKEIEAQAQRELDAAYQSMINRRAKEERELNQNQQKAIAENADRQRKEDAKTQKSKEAYQNWWIKSLREQEIAQKKANDQAKDKRIENNYKNGKSDMERQIKSAEQFNRTLKQVDNQLVSMFSKGQVEKSKFDDLSKRMGLAGTIQDLKNVEKELDDIGRKYKLQQGNGAGTLRGEVLGSSDRLKNLEGMDSKTFKNELQEIIKTNNHLKDKEILFTRLDAATGKWNATLRVNGREQLVISGAIDRTNGQIRRQRNEIREVSNANKGLIEQLKIAMGRVPVWMGAMTAFYGSIRTLQNMTRTIIEIDTQMTQLKRVMDEDTNFDEMLQKSIGLAKELGQTIQNVNEALIGFARQGFEGQDAIDMTRTAILASNVSDLSTEESMNDITSAMINFNIEASKSISIVDKLNEVDNNFSITTKDLAQGIHKAGATAKTYGVTLDELVGHVTAIGAATRESGNIVGNALKTIYSRIPSAAGDLEDLGVKVFNDDGTTRAATEVIDDLAKKWSTLTNTQQQNIGVTVAGRYQLTRFLALMNNYQMSLDAATTATYSQGSAVRENEKYQQSLQARINRMTVAWQEFTLAVGDAVLTDGLIAVVNSLTALSNAGTFLTKNFGVLPFIIAGVTTAIALFNNRIRTSILETGKLGIGLKGLALTFKGVGVAARTAGTFMAGIFWPVAISMALGFAIEKLVGWIAKSNEETKKALTLNTETVTSLREQKNGLTMLSQEYVALKEKTDKTVEDKQRLVDIERDLVDNYGVATSGIDDQGRAYSDSVQAINARVEALQKEIDAEISLNEIKLRAKDSENKNDLKRTYEDRKKAAEEVLRAEQDLANFQQRVQSGEFKNMKPIIDYQSGSVTTGEMVENSQKNAILKRLTTAKQELANYNAEIGEVVSEYELILSEKAQQILESLEQQGEKLSAGERAFVAGITEGIASGTDDIDTQFNELTQVIKAFTNTDFGEYHKKYEELRRAFEADPSDMTIQTEMEQIHAKLIEEINKIINEIIQKIPSAKAAMESFRDSFVTSFNLPKAPILAIVPDLQKMRDEIDKAGDEFSKLNQIIYTVSKGQKLNSQQVMELVKQYPELLKHIKKTADGYEIEEKAMLDLRDKRLEAKKQEILAEAGLTRGILNNLSVRLKAYGVELNGINNLADARKAISQNIDPVINAANPKNMLESFKTNMSGSDSVTGAVSNFLKSVGSVPEKQKLAKEAADAKGQLLEYAKIMEEFNGLYSLIDDASYGVTPDKTSNKSKDKKDKTKTENVALYQADQYAKKMAELETALKKSQNAMANMNKTSSEYRSELMKQNNALSAQSKATNDEIYRINKLIASQEKQRKAMGDFKKLSNEKKEKYNELTKSIEQNQGSVQSLTQKQSDLNKTMADNRSAVQVSVLEELHGKQKKYDDELEKSKNKQKNLLSTSAEKRAEDAKQIAIMKEKQNALHNENIAIQKAIDSGKLLKTDIEAQKQVMAQNSAEWLNLASAVDTTAESMVNSAITEQRDKIADIGYEISLVTESMNLFEEGTAEYNKALNENIALLGSQLRAEKQLQVVIKEQLKNMDITAETRARLNKELKESVLAELQLVSAIHDMNQELKQQQEQLADDIIDTIKEMYEQQKKLRLDALEEESDALEKAHNEEMSRLDKELKKYEEHINSKLKLLNREASARSFNNDLQEKAEQKNELQNKINILSLDDSSEAKKQRKELEKQLAEITKEIEDMQYDRTKEIREDNLQDQLENKQKEIETAKDTAEYIVNGQKMQYEKAKEFLDKQKKEVEKYYDDLINDEKFYQTLKEEMMAGHFGKVQEILQTVVTNYSDMVDDRIAKTGEKLNEQMALLQKAQEQLNQLQQAGDKTSAWSQYLSNKKAAEDEYAKTGKWNEELRKQNEQMRNQYGFADGNYADLSKLQYMGIQNPSNDSLSNIIGSSTGGIKSPTLPSGGAYAGSPFSNVANQINNLNKYLDFLGKKNTASTSGASIGTLSVNVSAVGADKKGAKDFASTLVDELKKKGIG
ncbi:TP901 family phage tail tape measure protein [Paenibacillus sp. LBL]|uniref:phage tail tape measure protein n=1 Tax=Paenibacillus sp. LBL TaxID=2940563 RepID=UPI002474CC3B|nr:phage tail tape measure protein [Paenibacillus sp. LBL]MDH6674439.1 TP901 family phage tail tape measure protein [Paenibacillus sp. LBL]